MKKEEHNARLRDHYIAIGIRISYLRDYLLSFF